MTIKRVYKNTMIGSQMILNNGKAIQFPQGRFETDVAAEIMELDANIAAGVPHLYVDPQDMTVDTEEVDFVRKAQAEATVRALKEFQQRKERESGVVVEGTLQKDPRIGTSLVPGASELQQEARVSEEANKKAKDADVAASLGSGDTAQAAVTAQEGQATPAPANANLATLLAKQAQTAAPKNAVGIGASGHGAV